MVIRSLKILEKERMLWYSGNYNIVLLVRRQRFCALNIYASFDLGGSEHYNINDHYGRVLALDVPLVFVGLSFAADYSLVMFALMFSDPFTPPCFPYYFCSPRGSGNGAVLT